MLMNMTSLLCTTLFLCRALDSSVGRAVDCSCDHQTSIGRWFKSGSRDSFFIHQLTAGLMYSIYSTRGAVGIDSSIV